MSDEKAPDIEEAIRTAVLGNYADVIHAKSFARNIVNLIRMAYMKAPQGSELEADLAAIEQYAGYVCFYFQNSENTLRGLLLQADSAEHSNVINENDTIH